LRFCDFAHSRERLHAARKRHGGAFHPCTHGFFL
jgi:hypothetical protein